MTGINDPMKFIMSGVLGFVVLIPGICLAQNTTTTISKTEAPPTSTITSTTTTETTVTTASNYQGLGKDSVTPEQIDNFRPKALPSDLSRRIQGFFDVRAPGLGMLHPTQNILFFTWRITGTTQVFRLDHPKGFPVQMTGGEDPTTLVDITADGNYLVLSRDRNGEENPGLYLQKTTGGPLILIQHQPKVQTLFSYSSNDSQFIYFRANDQKPDTYSIYRYNLQTKTKELIFSESGYWMIEDHWESKNGKKVEDKKLLLAKAITNTASEHYELDLATKKLTPLLGVGENIDYTVSYATTENQYIVKTNKFSEEQRLYWYENNKFTLLAPNEKQIAAQKKAQLKRSKNKKPVYEMNDEIEGFSVDPKQRYLSFVWNRMGYSQLELFDLKEKKSIAIRLDQSKADHVYSGAWSKSGKQLMLAIEDGTSPRMGYSLNLKSGLLTQWVVPSVPEVDLKQFVRSRSITIPTDYGGMPAFVRVPPQCENNKKLTQPCPVVVHFHGGPEGQSQPGFSPIWQLFVSEGFIVLEPNVRGSTGYGKKYLDSDNGAKRLQVIEDLKIVSDYAKKTWAVANVVPKVGVMGWSYGGYSTLYAMTKFAGSYDAGVALVGMSHLISFINNTAPYRRALRVSEYGDPEKDKEAMIELSPLTHMEKIKDPLLIIQGVSDPRVPAGEAIQMYNEMKKKGLPGELILFADEGHGSQKRSNQVLEIGHTLQFFKKHLQ